MAQAIADGLALDPAWRERGFADALAGRDLDRSAEDLVAYCCGYCDGTAERLARARTAATRRSGITRTPLLAIVAVLAGAVLLGTPAPAETLLDRMFGSEPPSAATNPNTESRKHLRRVRKRVVAKARTRGAAARVKSSPARAAAIPERAPEPGARNGDGDGDATPIRPRPVPTITVRTPFRQRFFFE